MIKLKELFGLDSENIYDEMQKHKREEIGNNMFLITIAALLLSVAFHHISGIAWLGYPDNILVILIACLVIYIIRLIASGAYIPVKSQSKKGVSRLALTKIISLATALSTVYILDTVNITDNPGIIIAVMVGVGILITVITNIYRHWRKPISRNAKKEE
ncbi:MAG: hypothetical protein FWD01_04920 [Defluviitaleaceae bacterium]|nr:hypothetical protein [Defluviitaleaceae bacterium]